jgi:hypothetical protein
MKQYISETNDLMIIGSYLDLLLAFNDCKILSEADRHSIGMLINKKIE